MVVGPMTPKDVMTEEFNYALLEDGQPPRWGLITCLVKSLLGERWNNINRWGILLFSIQASLEQQLSCQVTIPLKMQFSTLFLSSLAMSSSLVAASPALLRPRSDLRGFDVSEPPSSGFWACALNSGYEKAVIRMYQQACGSVSSFWYKTATPKHWITQGGKVDKNFVAIYNAAVAAGFTNIDAYVFPCRSLIMIDVRDWIFKVRVLSPPVWLASRSRPKSTKSSTSSRRIISLFKTFGSTSNLALVNVMLGILGEQLTLLLPRNGYRPWKRQGCSGGSMPTGKCWTLGLLNESKCMCR